MLASALLVTVVVTKTFTMRLHLQQGQTFAYKLSIDRSNPKQSGALTLNYKISRVDGDTVYMDAKMAKLSINGKDRTKDLKATVGDQVATLPWTTTCRRTGMMKAFNMNPVKPDIMPFLVEAGIYMPYFQKQEVKVGDTWHGSTTATGGCTSGQFHFTGTKDSGNKHLAVFEVTNIFFLDRDNEQVGPMKMLVDLSTGLPTVVDYKVKNKKSGCVSHFRQTRV